MYPERCSAWHAVRSLVLSACWWLPGKSSIVKLLERFYLPASGRVLLDGHDIGSYDSKWLRRRMAIVSQEPVLYARSIRDNILVGLAQQNGLPADEVHERRVCCPGQVPSEEDIVAAAKAANAYDFIMNMPNGFDTDCGDKVRDCRT